MQRANGLHFMEVRFLMACQRGLPYGQYFFRGQFLQYASIAKQQRMAAKDEKVTLVRMFRVWTGLQGIGCAASMKSGVRDAPTGPVQRSLLRERRRAKETKIKPKRIGAFPCRRGQADIPRVWPVGRIRYLKRCTGGPDMYL